MIKYVSLLILLLSSMLTSTANAWFDNQTPLSQAHKMLLENDLQASFSALIQVWQTNRDDYVDNHLNELLLKSLEPDCGKSLTSEPLASWISNIVIRRQSLQSPGRITSKLIIESQASVEIKSIRFSQWSDTDISPETDFEQVSSNGEFIYHARYALNQRLGPGLYRIEIENVNGEQWNSWVVMGESKSKEIVRWDTKDSWAVDKFGLLNPYCALPVLTVALYDYLDGEYKRVWYQEYETDYPTSLPLGKLTPDRYVLAVSITQKRWQGAIAIEDQQVISKTYDISAE